MRNPRGGLGYDATQIRRKPRLESIPPPAAAAAASVCKAPLARLVVNQLLP
jgi:hypothetical protein